MSWHFSFTAKTRTEAKAELSKRQESDTQCPAPVFAAVHSALDALPEEPATPISVSSHGHIDHGQDSSGALIRVETLPAARRAG
jgi:hypothetical protein